MLVNILLAAGESKRFGSNKLSHPFKNKPLISYGLKAIDGLNAKHNLLITQPKTYKVIKPYISNHWTIVLNEFHSKGFNHSLILGISNALKIKDISYILVHLADLPFVKTKHLNSLVTSKTNCASSYLDTIAPPLVINAQKSLELLDFLRAHPLTQPKEWLLRQTQFKLINCSEASMDIDTPNDIEYFNKDEKSK